MSGDCGHGWGWHHDGAAGPCYRCYEEQLNDLETYKRLGTLTPKEVNKRIKQLKRIIKKGNKNNNNGFGTFTR